MPVESVEPYVAKTSGVALPLPTYVAEEPGPSLGVGASPGGRADLVMILVLSVIGGLLLLLLLLGVALVKCRQGSAAAKQQRRPTAR